MAQCVFSRYEIKYRLTTTQYLLLMEQLKNYMQLDQYGKHTICNIYYDTNDNYLIRRSIDKPAYKEKLRLRSYGVPSLDSTVYLEIKKKYKKVVYKRRIPLKLYEAYDYLNKGIKPANQSQILKEIDYFIERYGLNQGIYIAYDRMAYFGIENNDFRVTFDTNIRSRRIGIGLEEGDHGDLLLDDDTYLMETKVLGTTPLWFTKILSELKIYPTSFSKYGNIYIKEMLKENVIC